VLNQNQ